MITSKKQDSEIKLVKALRKAENAEKVAEDYIQMRKSLYSKLSPLEIKQIQEKLKNARENKYQLFKGKTDNFAKLSEDYQTRYEQFLQSQPEVEFKRQQIIKNVADSYSILEILKANDKVKAELDSGLVSTFEDLDNKDQEKVDKIIEKKLKQLEDGYIIEDYDDKFDVTEEFDKYINDEVKKYRILLDKERNEKDII